MRKNPTRGPAASGRTLPTPQCPDEGGESRSGETGHRLAGGQRKPSPQAPHLGACCQPPRKKPSQKCQGIDGAQTQMTSPNLQHNTSGLQWGPMSETVKVAPSPSTWHQFPRPWNQPSLPHLAVWPLPSHSHRGGPNSEHSWSPRAPHAPVPIRSHTLSAHRSRLRCSATEPTWDQQTFQSRVSLCLAWWQGFRSASREQRCARDCKFSPVTAPPLS